jgi:hypothetical protein
LRTTLETWWQRFRPYADRNFQKAISVQFHSRFWELYLGCSLLELGKGLVPKRAQKGPDFQVIEAGRRFWIEAVVASPGTGDDQVPELPPQKGITWFRVPEEQIVLRYATVVREKYERFLDYRESGIVGPDEPYVIAVNGCKVPHSSDDEVPYPVQAVVPIGPLTVEFEWDRSQTTWYGNAYRSAIEKRSGSAVATDLFLNQTYEGISGVIFSRVGVEQAHGGLGQGFGFIHNPFALNPVPEGWIRIGDEFRYVVESGVLEHRIWRS